MPRCIGFRYRKRRLQTYLEMYIHTHSGYLFPVVLWHLGFECLPWLTDWGISFLLILFFVIPLFPPLRCITFFIWLVHSKRGNCAFSMRFFSEFYVVPKNICMFRKRENSWRHECMPSGKSTFLVDQYIRWIPSWLFGEICSASYTCHLQASQCIPMLYKEYEIKWIAVNMWKWSESWASYPSIVGRVWDMEIMEIATCLTCNYYEG